MGKRVLKDIKRNIKLRVLAALRESLKKISANRKFF
jgi:hypothetical protein